MSEERIKYLEARVEALENELRKKTYPLKESYEFMENIAIELERELEQL